MPLLLLRIVIRQVNNQLNLGLIRPSIRQQELRDHIQLHLHTQMLHMLQRHIELNKPIQAVLNITQSRCLTHVPTPHNCKHGGSSSWTTLLTRQQLKELTSLFNVEQEGKTARN